MNKALPHYGKIILLFLLVSPSCFVLKSSSPDPSITISLNQKQINSEKGIKLSQLRKNTHPYLSLEINDPKIIEKLSEASNLQIMLARGSRPVTSFQTDYNVPYRMGFGVDSLFHRAIAGDRLIFYVDDFILYNLAIR